MFHGPRPPAFSYPVLFCTAPFAHTLFRFAATIGSLVVQKLHAFQFNSCRFRVWVSSSLHSDIGGWEGDALTANKALTSLLTEQLKEALVVRW